MTITKQDAQRAWFDQMLRAHAVRGVPIYARGNAPFTAADAAGRGDRNAATHAADAVAPVGVVRGSTGWTAGGAWTPTAAPAHRVAPDALAALFTPDAVTGHTLATLRPIGRAGLLYSVEPRLAVPHHETLNVAPADVPPAATVRPGAQATRAPRSTMVDRMEHYSATHRTEMAAVPFLGLFGLVPFRVAMYGAATVPQVNVPATIVAAQAADPTRYLHSADALERAADAFLATHGREGYDWHAVTYRGKARRVVAWKRPDRYERGAQRWQTRADRTAHRGTARFPMPTAARSERTVSDRTERIGTRFLCRTDVAWHAVCQCGAAHAAQRKARATRYALRTATDEGRADEIRTAARKAIGALRAACQCERVRFIGHTAHRVTTVRSTRAAASATRAATGAAQRGKAAGPWSLAASSLPRRVQSAGVAVEAQRIEEVLRTAALGAVLTFGTLRVTVLDGAQCVVQHAAHGAPSAYPLRELARRAAIAGVAADDIG